MKKIILMQKSSKENHMCEFYKNKTHSAFHELVRESKYPNIKPFKITELRACAENKVMYKF